MRPTALLLPLLLSACCATPPRATPPSPTPKHGGHAKHDEKHGGHAKHDEQHGDHATVTRRFKSAEYWARRFEDPKRDTWQKPKQVLKLLGLAPDAKVADIGAATGYFPVRFARAVPRGVVYGVDIEPTLINYLNLRAKREKLHNLIGLVCKTDDPSIPEPVDLVFVCNTYHHIGDRVEYFTALRDVLRPKGRLVIVDFKLGKFPVGPKPGHKIPAAKVEAELKAAGYRCVKRGDLPYQYVLFFEPSPR